LNILFAFRTFEQLALALKNRLCHEFTVLHIYFLSFKIFEQLALALKTEFGLKELLSPASCAYAGRCLWMSQTFGAADGVISKVMASRVEPAGEASCMPYRRTAFGPKKHRTLHDGQRSDREHDHE